MHQQKRKKKVVKGKKQTKKATTPHDVFHKAMQLCQEVKQKKLITTQASLTYGNTPSPLDNPLVEWGGVTEDDFKYTDRESACLQVECLVSRLESSLWNSFQSIFGFVLVPGRCTLRGTDVSNQAYLRSVLVHAPSYYFRNPCACHVYMRLERALDGKIDFYPLLLTWFCKPLCDLVVAYLPILTFGCLSHSEFAMEVNYVELSNLYRKNL